MATKCWILRLKSTKFDFGWGSAPDPAGELAEPPKPPAGFKGLTFRERDGKEREGEEREGEGLCHGRWGMNAPVTVIPQY